MPSATDIPYLDTVLNAKLVFWAGHWPPLARMAASTALFDPAQDHRLPPDMHRRFNVVLLLEQDLATYKQWPVILDEALRLLRHDGLLVLRYGYTPLANVSALKHHILAWTGAAVQPVFENTSRDGQTQLGVRLTMPERPQPDLAGFSFALISDGRRLSGITGFIDSVRRLHGIERIGYEIIVCGPPSIAEMAANWGTDCRIVNDPGRFPDLGWITHKKNLCIEAALHENVVVAHDRYVLAPDFLHEMTKFGADFDVLVCRQVNTDGSRFPDWVTLGSTWSNTSPAMLSYDEYCRNQYINGGIIIAKRETLRRSGWNELLFWGQAEDVELTRRLQAQAIVPRLARKVVAINTTSRPDYVASFETFPASPNAYFLSQSGAARGELQAAYYRLGTEIGLTDSPHRLCADHGVRLAGDWKTGPLGATISGAESGEIFIRFVALPQADLELVLECEQAPESFVIMADGQALTLWRDAEGWLRVRLPDALLRLSTLRLYLTLQGSSGRLTIRSFEVRLASPERHLAAGDRLDFRTGGNGVAWLAEGWSGAEPWGIWAIGASSALYLPLPPANGRDQWLEVGGVGYAVPGEPINILGLTINRIPIGHVRLETTETPTTFRFSVPEGLLSSRGPFRLGFHPQHTITPAALGRSVDLREISLGLQHIVYLGSVPE